MGLPHWPGGARGLPQAQQSALTLDPCTRHQECRHAATENPRQSRERSAATAARTWHRSPSSRRGPVDGDSPGQRAHISMDDMHDLVRRVCDLLRELRAVASFRKSHGTGWSIVAECTVRRSGWIRGCNLNPIQVVAASPIPHWATGTGIRSTRPWSSSTYRR